MLFGFPNHFSKPAVQVKASNKKSVQGFTAEFTALEVINFAKSAALEKCSENIKNRIEDVMYKSRKMNERYKTRDFVDMETAKITYIPLRICVMTLSLCG